MDKRVTKTIVGIVLILVGFAVLAIFNWNIFALNLPEWADIPATIIGMPLPVWGTMYIVNTNKK